jgi:adenylate cyclase
VCEPSDRAMAGPTEKLYKRRRLPSFVDRAISIAVLPEDDEETRRTKRLITGAFWISVVVPWPQIADLMRADAPLAAATIGVSFVTAVVVLVILFVQPRWFTGAFHLVAVANLAIAVTMTLLFGGFLASAINFTYAVIVVFGAIVVLADWRAMAWLAIWIVALVASVLGATVIEPRYVYPNPEAGAVITFLIILVFASVVFFYYTRQRKELLRVSDDLLRNILPTPIAERLKVSDVMIADEYDDASVLFADVVDFTPMSADMSPSELVTLLNEVFSAFDVMVERCGLEKIKTIGDAYMVASGVPQARSDHAEAICDLALEMQTIVEKELFADHRLTFRIGINSGPVVAGIIGNRKFSYDLWGDTVNTASRMESGGRPGRIQITGATKALVDHEFTCEPGGLIDVKGKGPMNVWYLHGRKTR